MTRGSKIFFYFRFLALYLTLNPGYLCLNISLNSVASSSNFLFSPPVIAFHLIPAILENSTKDKVLSRVRASLRLKRMNALGGRLGRLESLKGSCSISVGSNSGLGLMSNLVSETGHSSSERLTVEAVVKSKEGSEKGNWS